MRIIGGLARGLQLKSPHQGAGIKPTMDRVREAIFNSIEPIMGKTIVDLFSGSGALGLEACSRQADRVAWFEMERSLCKIIGENIQRVTKSLGDAMPENTVFQSDILAAPRLLPHWQPDIILADPPYNPNDKQKGSLELLTNQAFHDWAGDALLIMEQSKHNPLDPQCLKLWHVARQKKYGNQLVYYLKVK
ncbi:16S rRNA (guanine(966)-N(2))-methyltransferase RsmD [bacterium F16]|nr:16S rRNA (guanine(966)-N(2))-methyltransferase RsmD [bacterium F16]